jgi:hypothetical protein
MRDPSSHNQASPKMNNERNLEPPGICGCRFAINFDARRTCLENLLLDGTIVLGEPPTASIGDAEFHNIRPVNIRTHGGGQQTGRQLQCKLTKMSVC